MNQTTSTTHNPEPLFLTDKIQYVLRQQSLPCTSSEIAAQTRAAFPETNLASVMTMVSSMARKGEIQRIVSVNSKNRYAAWQQAPATIPLRPETQRSTTPANPALRQPIATETTSRGLGINLTKPLGEALKVVRKMKSMELGHKINRDELFIAALQSFLQDRPYQEEGFFLAKPLHPITHHFTPEPAQQELAQSFHWLIQDPNFWRLPVAIDQGKMSGRSTENAISQTVVLHSAVIWYLVNHLTKNCKLHPKIQDYLFYAASNYRFREEDIVSAYREVFHKIRFREQQQAAPASVQTVLLPRAPDRPTDQGVPQIQADFSSGRIVLQLSFPSSPAIESLVLQILEGIKASTTQPKDS